MFQIIGRYAGVQRHRLHIQFTPIIVVDIDEDIAKALKLFRLRFVLSVQHPPHILNEITDKKQKIPGTTQILNFAYIISIDQIAKHRTETVKMTDMNKRFFFVISARRKQIFRLTPRKVDPIVPPRPFRIGIVFVLLPGIQ